MLLVSSGVHNRVCQNLEIQQCAVGVICLRKGWQWACGSDPSLPSSPVIKIGRKVAGIALLLGGLAGLYSGASPLIAAQTNGLQEIFMFGQNPVPIILPDTYEEEFNASPSYVNHSSPDLLYLAASSEADHNGAFNPLRPSSLPRCLSEISALRYKVIQHPFQICEEIALAGGSVKDLVIGGHGDEGAVTLSSTSSFQIFDVLPADCFAGLSNEARIFLDSCSTGKNSPWRPNVAEWLSAISGREVRAPAIDVKSKQVTCSIESSAGRVDIRFLDEHQKFFFGSLGIFLARFDHTQSFNVSSSFQDSASFNLKMAVTAILGVVVAWQTMRVGAAVLQVGGAAGEWAVDRSLAPVKLVCGKIGLCDPIGAKLLHMAAKGPSRVLNIAGKTVHQGMEMALSFAVSAVANAAQFLGSKCWKTCVAIAEKGKWVRK